MWSKTNPGPFDRYASAEAEEPVFILRGSDPVATLLVSLWVGVHDVMGDNAPAAALDAMQCAAHMEQWARGRGRDLDRAVNAFLTVLRNAQLAAFAALDEKRSRAALN